MIPAATSSTPLSQTSAVNENQVCFCTSLCERVAAVWNAFLALLCEFVSYCGSWFNGAQREEQLKALLERYESFAETTLVRTWRENAQVGWRPIGMRGNSLPYAVKMEKVREVIAKDRLLFLVANPFYTRPGGNASDPEANNRTKLLLELGADPNQPNPMGPGTPILFAFMTGSFLAYKTLREFGALPVVQCEGFTRDLIDLAKRTVAEKYTNCSSIYHYFTKILCVSRYKELLPYEVVQEPSKYLGSDADVQKMIDFENARIARVAEAITELCPISPPLANIIATYNEYY